jgi:hypothetical protein
MTSRSNWAKDNRTLRVRRPIEVVVLNRCVTETKDALHSQQRARDRKFADSPLEGEGFELPVRRENGYLLSPGPCLSP